MSTCKRCQSLRFDVSDARHDLHVACRRANSNARHATHYRNQIPALKARLMEVYAAQDAHAIECQVPA